DAKSEDLGLMARFLFAAPPPLPDDYQPAEVSKAEESALRDEFAAAIRAIYYGGTLAAAEALERAEKYRPQYVHDPSLPPIPDLADDDDGPSKGRPRAEFCAPAPEILQRPDTRVPVDVLFTGESLEALQALEAELKALAVEGGEHFTARTWVRKAHEHAMRIAAVLQLCETPPRDHEQITMDPAWTRRAIALVKHYFIPHYYVAKDLIESPAHAELGLHMLTHFADRDCFSLGEASAFVNKR